MRTTFTRASQRFARASHFWSAPFMSTAYSTFDYQLANLGSQTITLLQSFIALHRFGE